MPRFKRIYWTGPAAAVLIPYLIFEWLRRHEALDLYLPMPRGHFYLVSIVSLLAAMIAAAIGISGSRLRNLKVTLLSMSFLSLAGIFAIHGLSTPGLMMHSAHLARVSAQGSILVAVFWLWLSTLPSDHGLLRFFARWQGLLVPVWALMLTGMVVGSLAFPEVVEIIPLDHNPLQWIASGVTVAMNLHVIYRFMQDYLYARLPLQLAIVYSACWLIGAQLIMILGETWRMSWWTYHFLLLASMVIMISGFFTQYAAGAPLSQMFRSLFSNDPVIRIQACISPRVRALVTATESRDTYTAGHNFRVAMYALRLGEELELRPEQLRALAQGAVVHDVGKIQIPDSILNKPGRLTPDERKIIEAHPVVGYDMCQRVGFMKDELDVIRSHHERWDGCGYPDRLQGERIPLLARIAAVADVYDALTSTRSYRVAWSHEEALKNLSEGAGTQFDPVCVDAWIRLCAKAPEVYLRPASMQTEPAAMSLASANP